MTGELLTRPVLAADPQPLGAPDPALDAFTRARVDEAAAAGYERGLADGAAAVRAEATAAEARITAALDAACAAVTAELRSVVTARVDADVELASAIAEAVLGHEPSANGAALLALVRTALASLDETDLTVHAHPDDAAALAAGVRGSQPGLTVTADAGLGPGEARITGRWARAELTRAAALDVVRSALGATS